MNSSLHKTLLIVAHDAGGALLLSHWACQIYNRQKNANTGCLQVEFEFALSGPAVSIFKEVFEKSLYNKHLTTSTPELPVLNVSNVLGAHDTWAHGQKAQWQQLDGIITGSGWQTHFEQAHIAAAKTLGVPCATYLDHWANYRQRFAAIKGKGKEQLQLPDELWVADSQARVCAQQAFKHERPKIRLIRNRYLQDLRQQVCHQRTAQTQIEPDVTRHLICLEPVRRDDVNYTTLYKPMVDYLVSQTSDQYSGQCSLQSSDTDTRQQVVIRLHPSQADCGFEQLQSLLIQAEIPFVISDANLIQDLALANTVFGYQSSVLVYAMALDLPVHSFYPAHKMEPILPHSGIHYL